MEGTKYNERLREIAEKMAIINFHGDPGNDIEAWESAVLHKIPFAKIAIAEMSQAFKWGYAYGTEEDLSVDPWRKLLIKWQDVFGFLPNNK